MATYIVGNGGSDPGDVCTWGKIGIGTTSPGYALDVIGNAARIHNQGSSNTTYNSISANNSDGDGIEQIAYGRSVTATPYLGLDRAGAVFVGGVPNTGMGVGTRNSTPLVLGTNDTEQVRITASGRVGIGTATPFNHAKCHVYSNEENGPAIYAETSNSSGLALQAMAMNGGTAVSANNEVSGYAINALSGGTGVAGRFFHYQSSSSVTILAAESLAGGVISRFAVKGDGKVGISTTAPDTLLHLGGSNAALTIAETSNTPTPPTTQDKVRIYVKGDKLVIQFKDGANTRYKWLALTGTGVTWQQSTTAP